MSPCVKECEADDQESLSEDELPTDQTKKELMEIYEELCQDSFEDSSTGEEEEVFQESSDDEGQIQENPHKDNLPEKNPEQGGLETMDDLKRWISHLIEEDAEDDRLHRESLAALVKEQAEARAARRVISAKGTQAKTPNVNTSSNFENEETSQQPIKDWPMGIRPKLPSFSGGPLTDGKALEKSLAESWNLFETNHPEAAAACQISKEEEDRSMAELVKMRQPLISAEETPYVNTSSNFGTSKSGKILQEPSPLQDGSEKSQKEDNTSDEAGAEEKDEEDDDEEGDDV